MMSKETVFVGKFPVRSLSKESLAAELLRHVREKQKVILLFANTNFIVKCQAYLKQISTGPVILVNDGIGLDIAAVLTRGKRFPENLNGTDFTPYLFSRSDKPLRVFMLGAKPATLVRAVAQVEKLYGQNIVGSCDGYDGMKFSDNLATKINQTSPDILLVALGNPMQEKWIFENHLSLNVPVIIGVGALFDFWSGEVSRAPKVVQQFRLEWLYRLVHEPRRLFLRYTFDILVFLKYCFKNR